MTQAIWSLPRIEELLNHPEPSVQKWAVAKLFALFPEEAEKRLPYLLVGDRPTVVARSLDHLAETARPEFTSILKRLYLEAEGEISARAMEIAGLWRIDDAVGWVKERILERQPLSEAQILSMIHALGQIPSEDAYLLLKHTEDAVQDKGANRYRLFYSALLRHHRVEDVETLLDVVVDSSLREERRRDAMGLLLGEMDPQVNPTDAFFGNHAALGKYWGKALEEMGHSLPDPGLGPLTDALKDFLLRVTADLVSESGEALEKLDGLCLDLPQFQTEVFRRARNRIPVASQDGEWGYALVCLGVSALFSGLRERLYTFPPPDAHWREKAAYLLADRPPRPGDEPLETELIEGAHEGELIALVGAHLRDEPESWGAVRAVSILGKLRALEAVPSILAVLAGATDELMPRVAQRALISMGVEIIPQVLPFLDSSDRLEKFTALNIFAALPTQEAVDALMERFSSLYAEQEDILLETVSEMGGPEFLGPLAVEYRPGESAIGRAYLHICRVNGLDPPLLKEIEDVVRAADVAAAEQKRILAGEAGHWPETIPLELACRECGKKYSYDIRDVHLHPHGEKEIEGHGEPGAEMLPYRQGTVICDDISCKNCGAVNRFKLTDKTLMQLTSESVKILAFRRSGVEIPPTYPVKHVRAGERDGKPLSLVEMEKDHRKAADLSPGQPSVHLTLGKFYEYVKESSLARKSYLRALDNDSRALEAMAGLARLAHSERDLDKAFEWIGDCYESLDQGKIYLAGDASEFKKVVREKRREYARELGVRVDDQPVKIRFSIDMPDYPKNRPCPCGSGKKYKLCCMKVERP